MGGVGCVTGRDEVAVVQVADALRLINRECRSWWRLGTARGKYTLS